MIFAHLPENIVQIAIVDSFTVRSGLILENRFYTRDTSNFSVRLSK